MRHVVETLSSLRLERLSLPSRRDQDRIRVRAFEGGLLIALADGAGGMAHADRAADLAIARAIERPMDADGVLALDRDVARLGGETTLICMTVTPRPGGSMDARGHSVGDSRAWARRGGQWTELTDGQHRRRLGSGEVRPLAFALRDVDRVFVVSDGVLDLMTEDALLARDGLADLGSLVPRDDASAILIDVV